MKCDPANISYDVPHFTESSSSDGQENIQRLNRVIQTAADNDRILDAYSSHCSGYQELPSESTDSQETDKDNLVHAIILPRRRVRKPR